MSSTGSDAGSRDARGVRHRPTIWDYPTAGSTKRKVRLSECVSAEEKDRVAKTAQKMVDDFRVANPGRPGISFQGPNGDKTQGRWWDQPKQTDVAAVQVDVSARVPQCATVSKRKVDLRDHPGRHLSQSLIHSFIPGVRSSRGGARSATERMANFPEGRHCQEEGTRDRLELDRRVHAFEELLTRAQAQRRTSD